jgi:hypothetical protein
VDGAGECLEMLTGDKSASRFRDTFRFVVVPEPVFPNRFSGPPGPLKEKKFHEKEKKFAFRGK